MSTRKFEQSQATAGGVSTQEICANTMESNYVRDSFFAGEVIDIDGMSAGYNLQWAWTSGYVAGTSAAKKTRQSESGKGTEMIRIQQLKMPLSHKREDIIKKAAKRCKIKTGTDIKFRNCQTIGGCQKEK